MKTSRVLRRISAAALALCMALTNLTSAVGAAGLWPEPYPENSAGGGYNTWKLAPDAPLEGDTPLDDGYLESIVTVRMEAVENNAANTGKPLRARILAFNNSPNAARVSDVKVEIKDTTGGTPQPVYGSGSKGDRHLWFNSEKLLQEPIDGGFGGDAGENPGQIGVEWHDPGTVEENGAFNQFGYILISLPAGSSISFEIELDTLAGYDKDLSAQISATYMHYDETTGGMVWNDKPEEAVAPIDFTWTGSFDWTDFAKKSDAESVVALAPADDSLVKYTFAGSTKFDGLVDNNTAAAVPDYAAQPYADGGYILTNSLTLEDRLTMPSGVAMPENAVLSADGRAVLTSAGETVYEIIIDQTEDFTVDGGFTGTDGTFSLIFTRNPAVADPQWNPLKNVSAALHADKLQIDGNAFDNGAVPRVENTAAITVVSVTGDVDTLDAAGLPMTRTAGFDIVAAGRARLNKEIISVSGNYITIPQGSKNYFVSDGARITYRLTLENPSGTASAMTKGKPITDTFGANLSFDESSVEISGVDGWTLGNEVVKSVDGKTATFTLRENLPAGAELVIEYSADVVGLASSAADLKNTAQFGEDIKEAEVRARTESVVTLDKYLVSRYLPTSSSETSSPSFATITASPTLINTIKGKDKDYPNFEWDYTKLTGKSSIPFADGLEGYKAILEMNQGNYYVYVLKIVNEGEQDYVGTVVDQLPFTGPYTGCNDVGVYLYGDSVYYEFTGGSYSRYSNSSERDLYSRAASSAANAMWSDLSGFSYHVLTNAPIDRSGYGIQWDNVTIPANTVLYQTVVVKAPGHAGYSSEHEENNSFLEFAAKYRTYYNAATGYLKGGAVLRISYPVTPGSDNTRTAANLPEHTVARQISLQTGVLSTAKLRDGKMRMADGSYSEIERDNTKFELDENQEIANYITIFNDSSREMDLSEYELNIIVPKGFEFLGFVQLSSSSEFDTPRDTVTVNDPGSSQLLTLQNYTGPSLYFFNGTSGPPATGLFRGSGIGFTKNNVSNSGYTIISVSMSGKLRPYGGTAVGYIAKLNDDGMKTYELQTDCASFGAYIRSNSTIWHHASAAVKSTVKAPNGTRITPNDGGIYSAWAYRSGTGTNGADHKYNGYDINGTAQMFHSAPKDTNGSESSFPHAGDPSCIWSFVTLHPSIGYVNAAVNKRVVENKGSNDKNNPSLEDSGYTFDYIPHDGIHRTVDGTVRWRVSVTNKGDNTNNGSANSKTYVDLDYGVLVDTIDMPYKLNSIIFPANSIPLKHTVGPNISCVTVPASNLEIDFSDLAAGQSKTVDIDEATGLKIRVTAVSVEGGSIASGHDAENRPANSNATRYIIEFAAGSGYETKLSCLGPGSFGCSCGSENHDKSGIHNKLEFDVKFTTDDSIITNYNSFGIIVRDVSAKFVDIDGSGEKKTGPHIGLNSNSASAAINGGFGFDNASLLAEPMSFAQADGGDFLPQDIPAPIASGGDDGFPLGSNPAAEAQSFIGNQDVAYAEYSDWTDTSYTDGEKTIRFFDKDGNPLVEDGRELSANTRTDGDEKLPDSEQIIPGETRVQTTLHVESYLYESENYDYIDNFKIYDVFGVEAGADDYDPRSAYIPDLSTIRVVGVSGINREVGQSLDEALKIANGYRELTLGVDYDIYYTFEPLVTHEHLNITPINSLKYAADLGKLESVDWILYDPNAAKGEAGSGFDAEGNAAWGIKIVLKGDADGFYNSQKHSVQRNTFTDCYVEFMSTVSKDLIADGDKIPYPNVLAYSADIYNLDKNPSDPEYAKHFDEDTTAAYAEIQTVTGPNFTKSVVGEDDLPIESYDTCDFTFGVIRAKSTSLSASNVSGIAVMTLKPTEAVTVKNLSDHLRVIYSANGAELNADNFFNYNSAGGNTFIIFEMPDSQGNFTLTFTTERSNDPDMRKGSTSVRLSNLKTVETSDADFNKLLTEYSSSISGYYFTPNGDGYWLSISAVNKAGKPNLELHKVDSVSNELIAQNVEFRIYRPGEATPLSFTKVEEGVYAYAETAAPDTVTTVAMADGIIRITGLMPGRYELEELNAPLGYKTPTERITLDVRGAKRNDFEVVDIPNFPDPDGLRGTATITKISSDGTEIDFAAAGEAKFALYGEDYYEDDGSVNASAQAYSFTRTADGEYAFDDGMAEAFTREPETFGGKLKLTNLPVDPMAAATVYYLVETDAPKGYDVNGEPLVITFARETLAEGFTAEVEDKPISAQLRLYKLDADKFAALEAPDEDFAEAVIDDSPAGFGIYLKSAPLAPLTFNLASDGSYEYSPDGEITVLKTANGVLAVTGLTEEEYIIREVSAPAGYVLAEAEIELNVTESSEYIVKCVNEKANITLRVNKRWKAEGTEADYAQKGVAFSLYRLNSDGVTAELVDTATTANDGTAAFETGLKRDAQYYLVETEVKDYELVEPRADFVKGFLRDGVLHFDEENMADGEKLINAIKIDFASESADWKTSEGGAATFTENVLNLRVNTGGNAFNSFSFKKIDNHKIAEFYGIPEEEGYSYYYTKQDYADNNHFNYVHALLSGDVVTYTLTVKNLSSFSYGAFSIVDRMPNEDDGGVLSPEDRNSRFSIRNTAEPFIVLVDGRELPESLYNVEFSTAEKFTDSDFDGTETDESRWLDISEVKLVSGRESGADWQTVDTLSAEYKSFRVIFDKNFALEPGQTLEVVYDGKIFNAQPEIDENIQPEIGGSASADDPNIAWNNFAYRYTAALPNGAEPAVISAFSEIVSSGLNTATPEPPKVGVIVTRTAGALSVKKTLEYDSDRFTEALKGREFTFKLHFDGYVPEKGEPADPNVSVQYGDINESDVMQLTEENGQITFKVEAGKSAEESFKRLWFSKPGIYSFTLSEAVPEGGVTNSDGTVTVGDTTYSTEEYKLVYTVTAEDFKEYINDDSYTVKDVSADGVQSGGDPALEFTNRIEALGSLSVKKTVSRENSKDADEKTYDIKITLTAGRIALPAELKYTAAGEGKTVKTDGKTAVIEAEIKADETVLIENLPQGTGYAAAEENADGYTVKYTVDGTEVKEVSGTVEENGREIAVVIDNSFNEGTLVVSKKVEAAGETLYYYSKDEFGFTVTLKDANGSPVTGKFPRYTATIPASGEPEWEKDGDAEFKSGVFNVTLKDGEAVKIAQIPAGFTYGVTEDDYSESLAPYYGDKPAPLTGTVKTDEEARAEMVNKLAVRDLILSKTVKNENKAYDDTKDVFGFTIKLTRGEEPVAGEFTVDGTVRDEKGVETSAKSVKFGTDGTAKVWLKGGDKLRIVVLPSDCEYTITEDRNIVYAETEPQSGKIGYGGPIDCEFVNTAEIRDVKLSKTIAANGYTGLYKFTDDLFGFTLKLMNGENPVAGSYPITGTLRDKDGKQLTDTTLTFGADGTARVWLKASESLSICGIPSAYKFEAAEDKSERYSTEHESSFNEDKTVQSEEFVNSIEFRDLILSKTVKNENKSYDDTKDVFGFTVKLTRGEEPVAGEFTVDGTVRDEKGVETSAKSVKFGTDGTAKVWLKGGDKLRIVVLPSDCEYTITEDRNIVYAETEPQSGKIGYGGPIDCEFVNTAEIRDVKLSKTIAANGYTGLYKFTDDLFGFTLKLMNGENPVAGSYPITGTLRDKDGKQLTDTTLTFGADGTARVWLKASESLSICGIPSAYKFEAAEDKSERYSTEHESSFNEDKTVQSEEFVNTVDFGDVSVLKIAEGGPASRRFELEIGLGGLTGEYVIHYSSQKAGEADGKISDGGTVTLSSGETATVYGIPAGTKVTFNEKNSDGYIAIPALSQTKTIAAGQTAEFEFVNRFDTASLTVSKEIFARLEANTDPDKEFDFTLTLDSPEYSLSYTASEAESGEISIKIIPEDVSEGSPAPLVIENVIKLKDGEKAVVTGIPNGTHYVIEEIPAYGYTPGYAAGRVEGTVDTRNPEEAAEAPAETVIPLRYVNTFEVGSVEISKEVTGSVMKPEKPFEFVLKVTDKDGNPLKNRKFGDFELDENSEYKFTLSDGESRLFENLPLGSAFTFTETADEDHYTVSNSISGENTVASGVIGEAGRKYSVKYTNDLNRGAISLTKHLVGTGGINDSEAGMTYTFTVDMFLDGDENRPVTGSYPSRRNGMAAADVVFDENGHAEITLSDGDTAEIRDLPALAKYTIVELLADRYEVTINGSVSDDGIIGGTVENGETGEYIYRNSRTALGGLRVRKTVVGSKADFSTRFLFAVKLSDKSINGQYGDMFFEDGVARIYLRHGESATATGLPEGIEYRVDEAYNPFYTATYYGRTGEIIDEQIVECEAVNAIISLGDLSISKTVIGENPDYEREFNFVVTFADAFGNENREYYSYSGSRSGIIRSGDTIKLRHGESITIYGLPEGIRYTVTEIVPEGYVCLSSGTVGVISENVLSYARFENSEENVPDVPESPIETASEGEGGGIDSTHSGSGLLLIALAAALAATAAAIAVKKLKR